MKKMKGQVSTELLVIVGFVVLLFIPMVLFVYYKTGELNNGIEGMQSKLIASKLGFIANALGSMGDNNALKVEFTLPERVRSLEFRKWTPGEGGEVLITLNDGTQISQVTAFPFESNRTYDSGLSYKLEFLSQGGEILVTPSN
ncbi:Uncharacterised protein [uncultured archaeon]|nr:Uncharacterised protein [uncultured archaeon]